MSNRIESDLICPFTKEEEYEKKLPYAKAFISTMKEQDKGTRLKMLCEQFKKNSIMAPSSIDVSKEQDIVDCISTVLMDSDTKDASLAEKLSNKSTSILRCMNTYKNRKRMEKVILSIKNQIKNFPKSSCMIYLKYLNEMSVDYEQKRVIPCQPETMWILKSEPIADEERHETTNFMCIIFDCIRPSQNAREKAHIDSINKLKLQVNTDRLFGGSDITNDDFLGNEDLTYQSPFINSEWEDKNIIEGSSLRFGNLRIFCFESVDHIHKVVRLPPHRVKDFIENFGDVENMYQTLYNPTSTENIFTLPDFSDLKTTFYKHKKLYMYTHEEKSRFGKMLATFEKTTPYEKWVMNKTVDDVKEVEKKMKDWFAIKDNLEVKNMSEFVANIEIFCKHFLHALHIKPLDFATDSELDFRLKYGISLRTKRAVNDQMTFNVSREEGSVPVNLNMYQSYEEYIFHQSDKNTKYSTRWTDIGETPPKRGKEIVMPELVDALQKGDMVLSKRVLDDLKIFLHDEDYVKIGNSYFRPGDQVQVDRYNFQMKRFFKRHKDEIYSTIAGDAQALIAFGTMVLHFLSIWWLPQIGWYIGQFAFVMGLSVATGGVGALILGATAMRIYSYIPKLLPGKNVRKSLGKDLQERSILYKLKTGYGWFGDITTFILGMFCMLTDCAWHKKEDIDSTELDNLMSLNRSHFRDEIQLVIFTENVKTNEVGGSEEIASRFVKNQERNWRSRYLPKLWSIPKIGRDALKSSVNLIQNVQTVMYSENSEETRRNYYVYVHEDKLGPNMSALGVFDLFDEYGELIKDKVKNLRDEETGEIRTGPYSIKELYNLVHKKNVFDYDQRVKSLDDVYLDDVYLDEANSKVKVGNKTIRDIEELPNFKEWYIQYIVTDMGGDNVGYYTKGPYTKTKLKYLYSCRKIQDDTFVGFVDAETQEEDMTFGLFKETDLYNEAILEDDEGKLQDSVKLGDSACQYGAKVHEVKSKILFKMMSSLFTGFTNVSQLVDSFEEQLDMFDSMTPPNPAVGQIVNKSFITLKQMKDKSVLSTFSQQSWIPLCIGHGGDYCPQSVFTTMRALRTSLRDKSETLDIALFDFQLSNNHFTNELLKQGINKLILKRIKKVDIVTGTSSILASISEVIRFMDTLEMKLPDTVKLFLEQSSKVLDNKVVKVTTNFLYKFYEVVKILIPIDLKPLVTQYLWPILKKIGSVVWNSATTRTLVKDFADALHMAGTDSAIIRQLPKEKWWMKLATMFNNPMGKIQGFADELIAYGDSTLGNIYQDNWKHLLLNSSHQRWEVIRQNFIRYYNIQSHEDKRMMKGLGYAFLSKGSKETNKYNFLFLAKGLYKELKGEYPLVAKISANFYNTTSEAAYKMIESKTGVNLQPLIDDAPDILPQMMRFLIWSSLEKTWQWSDVKGPELVGNKAFMKHSKPYDPSFMAQIVPFPISDIKSEAIMRKFRHFFQKEDISVNKEFEQMFSHKFLSAKYDEMVTNIKQMKVATIVNDNKSPEESSRIYLSNYQNVPLVPQIDEINQGKSMGVVYSLVFILTFKDKLRVFHEVMSNLFLMSYMSSIATKKSFLNNDEFTALYTNITEEYKEIGKHELADAMQSGWKMFHHHCTSAEGCIFLLRYATLFADPTFINFMYEVKVLKSTPNFSPSAGPFLKVKHYTGTDSVQYSRVPYHDQDGCMSFLKEAISNVNMRHEGRGTKVAITEDDKGKMVKVESEYITVLDAYGESKTELQRKYKLKEKIYSVKEEDDVIQDIYPSGLKWHKIEKSKAGKGDALRNEKLATALKEKQEFTEKEWESFDVKNLRSNNYIQSGENYFEPISNIHSIVLLKSGLKIKVPSCVLDFTDLMTEEQVVELSVDKEYKINKTEYTKTLAVIDIEKLESVKRHLEFCMFSSFKKEDIHVAEQPLPRILSESIQENNMIKESELRLKPQNYLNHFMEVLVPENLDGTSLEKFYVLRPHSSSEMIDGIRRAEVLNEGVNTIITPGKRIYDVFMVHGKLIVRHRLSDAIFECPRITTPPEGYDFTNPPNNVIYLPTTQEPVVAYDDYISAGNKKLNPKPDGHESYSMIQIGNDMLFSNHVDLQKQKEKYEFMFTSGVKEVEFHGSEKMKIEGLNADYTSDDMIVMSESGIVKRYPTGKLKMKDTSFHEYDTSFYGLYRFVQHQTHRLSFINSWNKIVSTIQKIKFIADTIKTSVSVLKSYVNITFGFFKNWGDGIQYAMNKAAQFGAAQQINSAITTNVLDKLGSERFIFSTPNGDIISTDDAHEQGALVKIRIQEVDPNIMEPAIEVPNLLYTFNPTKKKPLTEQGNEIVNYVSTVFVNFMISLQKTSFSSYIMLKYHENKWIPLIQNMTKDLLKAHQKAKTENTGAINVHDSSTEQVDTYDLNSIEVKNPTSDEEVEVQEETNFFSNIGAKLFGGGK